MALPLTLMTLLEVRSRIIAHFTDHDFFTLEDMDRIGVEAANETLRHDLVFEVLGDLAEAGIVRMIGGYESPPTEGEAEFPSHEAAEEEDPAWVLTAPLDASGHEITVSTPVAATVAQEINRFIRETGEEWPAADALQLNESHLLMLVAIITHLRERGAGGQNWQFDRSGGPN